MTASATRTKGACNQSCCLSDAGKTLPTPLLHAPPKLYCVQLHQKRAVFSVDIDCLTDLRILGPDVLARRPPNLLVLFFPSIAAPVNLRRSVGVLSLLCLRSWAWCCNLEMGEPGAIVGVVRPALKRHPISCVFCWILRDFAPSNLATHCSRYFV